MVIVVCELFYLKQSVTFVQAGNPIFGLFMTYKAIGVMLGGIINREGPSDFITIIFSTLAILPQVFVTR